MATLAPPNAESQIFSSEVKKTVDALAGHWSFEGTATEPGAEGSQKITMGIECKPVALGAAAACTFTGRVPSLGPVEALAVVGYSPDEQIVHWMEISSTGEYHDHRGNWNGNVIEFEPLDYRAFGKRSTERFTLNFPSAGRFVLKSVTETAEGLSTFTGTAKRF